jgi:hypothetical protein
VRGYNNFIIIGVKCFAKNKNGPRPLATEALSLPSNNRIIK